ncbi:CBS domain-containing protein [Janthinobacterium sp. RA13]|uniref:CBS domain-containing protein n=1 Tax=Janthinobacterium sp. RA13 TaxID=1502762 RepID=UPI000A9B2868|nr:CBS domain-containing protein [Janthinobacterium sp. RA13]
MEKTECTNYPIVSGVAIPRSDQTLDSVDSQNSKNTLDDNLSILADKLRHDNSATISIFVRDLVSWSGYLRRRGSSERRIQSALDKLRLRTLPDFRNAHISGEVMLQKIEDNIAPPLQTEIAKEMLQIDRDAHILKVGRLEAANRRPTKVAPGALIFEATSLMIKHNFSQLPIMSDERRVIGIISWKSIANQMLINNKLPERVDECSLPIETVSFDATLFDTISTIINKECVLVKKHDNTISGIITAADLGIQFSEMSEAFLKIGQIEAVLRMIIEKYYPLNEIKDAKDPGDAERIIERVDDLTFGEYKRLLENSEKWNQYFKQNTSRKVFIETLDEVRLIRNDVMHFDPAGIEEEDISTLSTALHFFISVKNMMR